MADFRVEQTYEEIERMVHEEVVSRLLSGPPEEAHLQPTKEEQEWAERVATEVTQGVMRQMDAADDGEHLAERLEGTEPLTDDEIRLCLEGLSLRAYRMSPVGLIDSARAKLRARLAREDG